MREHISKAPRKPRAIPGMENADQVPMVKKRKDPLSIYINAYAATLTTGGGLTGSDRIFIEWAREWSKSSKITIGVCDDGYEMCKNNQLKGVSYLVSNAGRFKRLGFQTHFAARLLLGSLNAIRMREHDPAGRTVVYSASDFWPDLIPSLILKKRIRNSKWVAGYYLSFSFGLAIRRFDPTGKVRFPRFEHVVYALTQKITRVLIRRYADAVFVTSEPDRRRFVSARLAARRVVAVRGGVDIDTPSLVPEPPLKKYDAVFLGRFHPQKGVIYLIDVWKLVCDKIPGAKLAMIGAGAAGNDPMYEAEVKRKITDLGLHDNIDVFGFMDGEEKIKIFKSSWMFLYPSTYGSGGMATGEAMASGLPAVTFDLEHLKTYYPKGLVKAPLKDLKSYADNIIKLRTDQQFYLRMKTEAVNLSKEWDWKIRAREVQSILEGLVE